MQGYSFNLTKLIVKQANRWHGVVANRRPEANLPRVCDIYGKGTPAPSLVRRAPAHDEQCLQTVARSDRQIWRTAGPHPPMSVAELLLGY
eukprot:5286488-Pyramimonas_sp.AAC.1